MWTEDCFHKTCVGGTIQLTPVVCPQSAVPSCPRNQVAQITDGCCETLTCDCERRRHRTAFHSFLFLRCRQLKPFFIVNVRRSLRAVRRPALHHFPGPGIRFSGRVHLHSGGGAVATPPPDHRRGQLLLLVGRTGHLRQRPHPQISEQHSYALYHRVFRSDGGCIFLLQTM